MAQHADLHSRYLDGNYTVLECQDYSTGLIDMESIYAMGASGTMAMSLLTLTTLFSCFLIYNFRCLRRWTSTR